MQLASFWKKQPALLYGLGCYLGITTALQYTWSLFPLLLIGSSLILGKEIKRFFLFILIVSAAAFFLAATVMLPPHSPIQGEAHIHISSIRPFQSSVTKGWTYQGTLCSFTSEGRLKARNVPFSLKFPNKKNSVPPEANRDYILHATLRSNQYGLAYLTPKKGAPWQPVPGTWSPAKWRLQNKMRLRQFINSKISKPAAASFLCGIATGLFDDNSLKEELSRFGLQHIMAISGFHFALVAFMLNLGIGCFLPAKRSAGAILLLLTLYFLFLGSTPSIVRAWLMASIFFFGKIYERSSRPLNSLGFALMVVLFLDPMYAVTLGFQFTFLVAASILLFYSPIERGLRSLLKKRTLSQLIQMDLLNQHGYLIVNVLRQILALTLAVQIAAAPLTLYAFQKLPLMSVVYNAFFPFLVSLSIFFLLLALILSPLPLLADGLHAFNGVYTEEVLNLAYHMPTSLDFWLRVERIPTEGLILYLCILLTAGIGLRAWMEKRLIERRDLAYI